MSRSSRSIKRVFKSGFLNFTRNKTVSVSSLAILTVTLLIIGIFFFLGGVFNYSLTQVKDKVDVKVYFNIDASSSSIQNVVKKVNDLPEVQESSLTSASGTLAQFQDKHSDDPVILEALDEIGQNPFGAVLTIKAKNTESYESIANTLNSGAGFLGADYNSISKINYLELKPTIDSLNHIINWINLAGYWIAMIFIVISSLIIFNTIRLSIFIYRDEISVMKLVGASNMHIRGPFLVESSIYALLSTMITMLLFLPITFWLSNQTTSFFNGFNLFHYYLDNFLSLFALLLLISLILSSFSSIIAIRKYLKV